MRYRRVLVTGALLALGAFTSPSMADGARPQVTSAGGATSWVLGSPWGELDMHGMVDPNGKATVCEFRYTDSGGDTRRVPCGVNPGSGDGAVSVSATVVGVSDASPVIQLVAFNGDGADYGEESPVPSGHYDFYSPPIVTTDSATGVSSTGATLNGTVDPQGSPTTCEFDYGPTVTYGHTVQCGQDPGSAEAPMSVSADILSSVPYADVHYRLRATNVEGTTVAYNRLVVVGDQPAHAAATGGGNFSWVPYAGLSGMLTLRGTIDPNGSAVTCEFEYGATLAYGHTAPCATEPGSGSEPVEVSAVVEDMPVELGLQTARYFRLIASGETGTAKGTGELVEPDPAPEPPGPCYGAGPPPYGCGPPGPWCDPDGPQSPFPGSCPEPCVAYPTGLGHLTSPNCGTLPEDPPPSGQRPPGTQPPGADGPGQTGGPRGFAAMKVPVTGRRGRLTVSCRGDRGSRCTGRFKLTRRQRRGGPLPRAIPLAGGRWILGTGRYDLAAGERRAVRVELTAIGKRLLVRAGGTLRARLIGAGLERRKVELRLPADRR
jgi:hypothetical protein